MTLYYSTTTLLDRLVLMLTTLGFTWSGLTIGLTNLNVLFLTKELYNFENYKWLPADVLRQDLT